jgi:hypothetical protein
MTTDPYPKFSSSWYRWRAQLMDDLTRDGWTPAELADRFDLCEKRIKTILSSWRKRDEPQNTDRQRPAAKTT